MEQGPWEMHSCIEQGPEEMCPPPAVGMRVLCATESSIIFIFKGTWEAGICKAPSKRKEKLAILLLIRATGKSENSLKNRTEA